MRAWENLGMPSSTSKTPCIQDTWVTVPWNLQNTGLSSLYVAFQTKMPAMIANDITNAKMSHPKDNWNHIW